MEGFVQENAAFARWLDHFKQPHEDDSQGLEALWDYTPAEAAAAGPSPSAHDAVAGGAATEASGGPGCDDAVDALIASAPGDGLCLFGAIGLAAYLSAHPDALPYHARKATVGDGIEHAFFAGPPKRRASERLRKGHGASSDGKTVADEDAATDVEDDEDDADLAMARKLQAEEVGGGSDALQAEFDKYETEKKSARARRRGCGHLRGACAALRRPAVRARRRVQAMCQLRAGQRTGLRHRACHLDAGRHQGRGQGASHLASAGRAAARVRVSCARAARVACSAC